MIKEFINNRNNLTIIQCILYCVVGYIMYIKEFDWIEISIIFVVVFGIQLLTRIKGVADGMMFRQLMSDNEWQVNDVIKKIKEEADKARKDNDIN